MDDEALTESMQKLLIVMQRLDEKIAPMLEADGELFNKRLAQRSSSNSSKPFSMVLLLVSSIFCETKE